MRIFRKNKFESKTYGAVQVRHGDSKGHVKVVRTLTLPSGKKVRVVRKDALDRALARSKSMAEAG